MTHELKPYPAMKDSGVPWLGDVPEHWERVRLKRILRPVDHRSSTGSETLLSLRRDHGVVVYADHFSRPPQGATTVGFKLVRAGQLVVNRMQANNGLVFHSRLDGLVSPDYSVFEASCPLLMDYLSELLRAPLYRAHFRRESTGLGTGSAGFLRLYDDRLLNTIVAVPPLAEQATIVRFLDHADRRIRRYIAVKQKLIKLLEEQKQAIIHTAVTRGLAAEGSAKEGLDPNVRVKPSGVEWLGDVPEHWEVKRLKWVTRLQRGYDLPADRRIPGPFPVVSSGGVIDSHCEYRSQAPGVVIGRYGSTDAVFFVEDDFWPHNTALFVTDFQGNRPRWCYYMLRTISKADHAGKSAVPGVDRKDLFQIMIPVPPVSEQDDVVAGIEKASVEIDSAITSAEREISLLREYRTRLTADVVTGKLDVREAAARLPDDPDVADVLDEAEPRGEGDEESKGADLDAAPDKAEV